MDEQASKIREIIIRDIFIALLVTIIGGVIVAYLAGEGRFATPTPEATPPSSLVPVPTEKPTTAPAPTEKATISLFQNRVSSSLCDDFDNTTLNSGWHWIDLKGDSSYSLTDNPGFLRITVYGRGHDLYQNLNAPRMLQDVEGNFTVATRVTINPQYNYQAAGLLYWQDQNNYVRLERTLVKGIDLLFRIRGVYNAVEIPFFVSTTFLKFEMSGLTLQGFYSEDGYNWSSVEAVQVPSSNNGQIGIDVVNEWQDNPISADFDYFKFDQCQ